MPSPVLPPPTRLERALSALWIAAVTALAIPALVAAFSREPSRPTPEKPAAAAADALSNSNRSTIDVAIESGRVDLER